MAKKEGTLKQPHMIDLDEEHQKYWELLKKNKIIIIEVIRKALKEEAKKIDNSK